MRSWKLGDPEPEDHPDLVATDDYDEDWHYRWESPNQTNGQYGGWWCWEFPGDLYDWSQITEENSVLTEDMTEDGDQEGGHDK